jgi:ligand-binding sensor domain-containing protein
MGIEPAAAQKFPDLRFSHLTDKDGLSNNDVRSMAQDKDGIIWIGTENGLDRYDGYGFRNFFTDPADPRTIQNNRIELLVSPGNDDIWGSTTDGIFCFHTRTQHADIFRSNPEDTATFGNPFHPPYIYIDSTRLPWVSTDEGLYHFADSLHYNRIWKTMNTLAPRIPRRSLPFGGLMKDKAGGLWSCWGNTIFKMDEHTKRPIRSYTCPDSILIRYIAFDSQNRCWVCSWGKGIYLFDPGAGSWRSFCPSPHRPVIWGAAEWYIEGIPYMVFSCSSPCLLFVNEEDLSTYPYPFNSSGVAFTAPPFVDRQNILWVPTDDGLYYSTPSNNLFSVITVPELPSDVGKAKYSNVYNMKEDSSGYWISKRDYGGVFWYDKHWRLIRSWYGVPVPPEGRFGAPGATAGEAFDFQRAGGQMFITTEAGISILDLRTLTWSMVAPGDIHPPARLRTIVVENDQRWWIRSFDHGVYIFNPTTRQFIRHYINSDSCKNCLPIAINYLIRDKHHHILATTNAGLYEYNEAADRFDKVRLPGAPSLNKALFGLACDSSGMLWIGSEDGLFACNPVTHTLWRTLKEDNKIGVVVRICPDSAQNIWFNSNSGYWCWLRKTDKVVHFEYSLGLPRTDAGIFYPTADGLVYGGGKDAVVKFYPDRLMNYRVTARTKILDAIVDDTVAAPVINEDGRPQLTLGPDHGSLSVDFDVINYDLIGTNQYFYRLSPGDNGWTRSESGHLVFYNLQPGSYTLEVKGASKLTGNFTNTDSLDIIVHPYWYRSTWFKIASILFICLVAWWLVRYRISMVRKEGDLRRKMAELEMMALRAQMNPHFIFNSLNSIENFIMQNERRLASDYLHKFATLIRLILENSRLQSVPLAKDMEAMQLYVDLEKLRFEDKFRYITEIDEELLHGDYGVPPLLIQPFVENAIVHGLAPSESKDLYLRISIRPDNGYIRYLIEDNGIGRSESMAYGRKYRQGHVSLGLQIIRERMDVINRQNRTESTLEIIDLHDGDRPAGTRVLLSIKMS